MQFHLNRFLTLLLAALVLAGAGARADASLATPAATVMLDNQHDAPCGPPPTEGCVAPLPAGDDPGAWQVNGSQRVDAVRVALHTGPLRTLLGELWPFPEEPYVVRGEDAHAPNPLVPLLAGLFREVPQPGGDYRVVLDEERVGVESYNPPLGDPTGEWGHRWYGASWGDEDVQYDQLGPSNTPGGLSTDDKVDATLRVLCVLSGVPGCAETAGAAFMAYAGAAPEVSGWYEWHDVEVDASA